MPSRLVVFVLLCFSLACGGSDDSTDTTFLAACRASCDQQGHATGCSIDLVAAVADCKTRCTFLDTRLDVVCKSKAQVAFECEAREDWECASDGETNTILVVVDGQCNAEQGPFYSCID